MPRKTADTETIRVLQPDGDITVTSPGVSSDTYTVTDHQIVVPTDDPNLPTLRGLETGSIEPTGTAGTDTEPETPADTKEP